MLPPLFGGGGGTEIYGEGKRAKRKATEKSQRKPGKEKVASQKNIERESHDHGTRAKKKGASKPLSPGENKRGEKHAGEGKPFHVLIEVMTVWQG